MSVLHKAGRYSNGVGSQTPEAVAGGYPLHEACLKGNLERTRKLLEEYPDLISARGDSGNTALHCAAANGREAVVNLLLSKEAYVNAKNGNGGTPLHNAAIGGYTDVAGSLLAGGAEIDAKDQYGYTPLQSAALKGQLPMVEFLLSKGASAIPLEKSADFSTDTRTEFRWAFYLAWLLVVGLIGAALWLAG